METTKEIRKIASKVPHIPLFIDNANSPNIEIPESDVLDFLDQHRSTLKRAWVCYVTEYAEDPCTLFEYAASVFIANRTLIEPSLN